MTTITEALRAARACIQQDRTSLADTGMRLDNTMEPDAAAGVAEYDAVLQQIDAALAGMTHHITDEQIEQAYEAEMRQSLRPQDRATVVRVCRAVLALAAPAPAVPSGWKLVPVEPTDAMVQAAHHIDLSYMPGQEGADRAAVYRAMLTAAHTSPAQPDPPQTTLGPVVEVWGWAIEDKHGVAQAIRPARKEFFGCVQSTEPFTAEDIVKMDREWAGVAPHHIVTLHTRHAEQPKCLTCNGHGLVGGHMHDGSGYGEGCPDCNPEPAVPESAGTPPAQPLRKPMTEDDMDVIMINLGAEMKGLRCWGWMDLVRAVEAHHGITARPKAARAAEKGGA